MSCDLRKRGYMNHIMSLRLRLQGRKVVFCRLTLLMFFGYDGPEAVR